MSSLVVRVHCGSAHVRGAARRYPYFVASLFEPHHTLAGRVVWVNTGISTHPRRSRRACEADGRALAAERGADFLEGYGSLHHVEVPARPAA